MTARARGGATWLATGSLVGLLATLPAAALAQGGEPSAGPTASPGPGRLGATTEVYRESFVSPPAWLDLGQDENGRTAVEEGAVFMSSVGDATNYRDWLELAYAVDVIRVEATVAIDSQPGTAAGTACGSSLGLPRWFIAGVNNADEWWFARQIDGRFMLVDRGPLILPIAPSRSAVRVGIECAVARDEGGDYVAVSVDGRPVSVRTGLGRLDIPVGPYDKAALFVGTDEGTGSAIFDDMVVHVGEAYAPSPYDREPDRPSE